MFTTRKPTCHFKGLIRYRETSYRDLLAKYAKLTIASIQNINIYWTKVNQYGKVNWYKTLNAFQSAFQIGDPNISLPEHSP